MSQYTALAIDLGGTRLRAALVDRNGKIIHRSSRQTPAEDGADAVVEAIASTCREVLANASLSRVLAAGLCSPGPIDAKRGVALGTPTIAGFMDFPLRQAVQDAIGLAVTVENDGPCAALGEWQFGAGRDARDFVYVTVSTGIGGGIVSEGRLVRGRRGIAGHVGHLPVKPGGAICFCGQPGCWEAEASGSALQRKAREAGFASLESVFDAARAGEPDATAFSGLAADDLAVGLVILIHALSPERIVIGGGVSNAFDVLGPLLQARVDARILSAFRGVKICKAALGDDSGLLGAAQLAFQPALRA